MDVKELASLGRTQEGAVLAGLSKDGAALAAESGCAYWDEWPSAVASSSRENTIVDVDHAASRV